MPHRTRGAERRQSAFARTGCGGNDYAGGGVAAGDAGLRHLWLGQGRASLPAHARKHHGRADRPERLQTRDDHLLRIAFLACIVDQSGARRPTFDPRQRHRLRRRLRPEDHRILRANHTRCDARRTAGRTFASRTRIPNGLRTIDRCPGATSRTAPERDGLFAIRRSPPPIFSPQSQAWNDASAASPAQST